MPHSCQTLPLQDRRAAASLLGVVLAKRPSIADFLVAEGALQSAVQLLLKGGPGAGDHSPVSALSRLFFEAWRPSRHGHAFVYVLTT